MLNFEKIHILTHDITKQKQNKKLSLNPERKASIYGFFFVFFANLARNIDWTPNTIFMYKFFLFVVYLKAANVLGVLISIHDMIRSRKNYSYAIYTSQAS